MTDSSNQPAAEERIVSENAVDALRLRLRRMTSPTISQPECCWRSIRRLGQRPWRKSWKVSASSSAKRAWILGERVGELERENSEPVLLHLAALDRRTGRDGRPDSTLTTIQRHTENGHGLATLRSPDAASRIITTYSR